MSVLVGKRFGVSLNLISCFLCPARGTVLAVKWRCQCADLLLLDGRAPVSGRAASVWEAGLSGGLDGSWTHKDLLLAAF